MMEATDERAGNFHRLADLPEPGIEDKLLEEVVEDLPADAQDHFQNAQEADALWEGTELTRYSIQINLTRISIDGSD